jgi:hypothetical protein
MEVPHNIDVNTMANMPPPAPADGGPAAPRDRPAPVTPAARARLAVVLALAVGVMIGLVASTLLGAPHLRLEALAHLLTTVRTSLGLGASHPAETLRTAESPQLVAPPRRWRPPWRRMSSRLMRPRRSA